MYKSTYVEATALIQYSQTKYPGAMNANIGHASLIDYCCEALF